MVKTGVSKSVKDFNIKWLPCDTTEGPFRQIDSATDGAWRSLDNSFWRTYTSRMIFWAYKSSKRMYVCTTYWTVWRHMICIPLHGTNMREVVDTVVAAQTADAPIVVFDLVFGAVVVAHAAPMLPPTCLPTSCCPLDAAPHCCPLMLAPSCCPLMSCPIILWPHADPLMLPPHAAPS